MNYEYIHIAKIVFFFKFPNAGDSICIFNAELLARNGISHTESRFYFLKMYLVCRFFFALIKELKYYSASIDCTFSNRDNKTTN